MPKKGWLLAALAWSFIVATLCLVSFSNFPHVGIKSADKYVHSTFHFVFTVLWFMYFRLRNNKITDFRNGFYVIMLSFVFGSLIELGQKYLTTTRSADIADVAANFTGSVLGLLVIITVRRILENKTTNKNV